MNYRGEVKLIRAGKSVHSFSYFSREERKIIIDRWRRLHGQDFDNMELHIAPVVIDEQDKKPNGRPKKEPERKFVRPPAIYGNRQFV